MKKILVVDKRLDWLKDKDPHNKRIILKRNITIIKDLRYIDNPSFISEVSEEASCKWYIEEWEVMNDDRIQLICANDGSRLRAVHIVSSTTPKDGVKALFQSEKMLILKLSGGLFEFSKNSINADGEIREDVIQVGKYNPDVSTEIDGNVKGNVTTTTLFNDIKLKLVSARKGCYVMIDSLIENHDKFKEDGYLAPIYASV